MHTDTRRGSFKDVIRTSNTQMAAVAHKLRNLIADVYPDVAEVPRPAEQHASYGVGLSKATEVFGYICPMPEYVRLGFYYGGALPDPKRLLQGEGKRLRHIKMYSLADVERPEVRRLIDAAIRERKKAHGLK
jgi:hypothetical protein